MQPDLIRNIRPYVARYSVIPSAVRGRRAPGLVDIALAYQVSVRPINLRRPEPLARNCVQSRLDAQRFLRIHRTYALDLEHVRACRRDARDLVSKSKDGTRLPVRWAQAQAVRLGRLGV